MKYPSSIEPFELGGVSKGYVFEGCAIPVGFDDAERGLNFDLRRVRYTNRFTRRTITILRISDRSSSVLFMGFTCTNGRAESDRVTRKIQLFECSARWNAVNVPFRYTTMHVWESFDVFVPTPVFVIGRWLFFVCCFLLVLLFLLHGRRFDSNRPTDPGDIDESNRSRLISETRVLFSARIVSLSLLLTIRLFDLGFRLSVIVKCDFFDRCRLLHLDRP